MKEEGLDRFRKSYAPVTAAIKRVLTPVLTIYALVVTCYNDHHAVRLASVHMIEESTITKLRNVVDLLTEKRDSLQITCFYANTEQRALPGKPVIILE